MVRLAIFIQIAETPDRADGTRDLIEHSLAIERNNLICSTHRTTFGSSATRAEITVHVLDYNAADGEHCDKCQGNPRSSERTKYTDHAYLPFPGIVAQRETDTAR